MCHLGIVGRPGVSWGVLGCLLNLPGTPYTSERVLRGVRVEMARKKNMRENKMRDK